MQKYSVVLSFALNNHVSDSVENNLEVEIKEFKPMTVLDSLDILDNVLDEVIEGMNEVTHKSDETSDLL